MSDWGRNENLAFQSYYDRVCDRDELQYRSECSDLSGGRLGKQSVYTGVTCEDDVFLGPSCVFTNVTNPRSAVNRKSQYAGTHVGKGATIGANATVVCGHDIGAYAFIGAGAVVTKHVPDYALLVGNPARQLGWMSEYGHRLYFDAEGIAECPESHEKYQLKDGKVFKL